MKGKGRRRKTEEEDNEYDDIDEKANDSLSPEGQNYYYYHHHHHHHHSTWSLTLREKRRLRAFEKRLLRRIFGPKREEVIREWRKLDIEELNDLNSSPNVVRVIKSR